MCTPVITSTIMVYMQVQDLATLVYRLKVQSKAVQLFLALQRNAETCFTILYGTHNFIRQFRQVTSGKPGKTFLLRRTPATPNNDILQECLPHLSRRRAPLAAMQSVLWQDIASTGPSPLQSKFSSFFPFCYNSVIIIESYRQSHRSEELSLLPSHLYFLQAYSQNYLYLFHL